MGWRKLGATSQPAIPARIGGRSRRISAIRIRRRRNVMGMGLLNIRESERMGSLAVEALFDETDRLSPSELAPNRQQSADCKSDHVSIQSEISLGAVQSEPHSLACTRNEKDASERGASDHDQAKPEREGVSHLAISTRKEQIQRGYT